MTCRKENLVIEQPTSSFTIFEVKKNNNNIWELKR